MRSEKSQTQTRLRTWLFTKPLLFACVCMCLGFLCGLCYAAIQTVFNFNSFIPMYILAGITFILPVYYLIKKLPHDKMSQSDFVAITNGVGFISVLTSIVLIPIIGIHGSMIRQKLFLLYLMHPMLSNVLYSLSLLFVVYLIGVAIVGIYAKYKRSITLGVTPWKAILSMPFGFLLIWTPGYLIKDKEDKSRLIIKSNWYNGFNKWVLSSFGNTLFIFLFLIFCRCLFTGPAVLMLSTLLLIIYTLWYTKHKSDFIKNIDDGYVLTAICINLAILIAIIVQLS